MVLEIVISVCLIISTIWLWRISYALIRLENGIYNLWVKLDDINNGINDL